MGKTSKEMREREKKISQPRHAIRNKWDMVHEDKRRAKKVRDDSRYYLDLTDDIEECPEEEDNRFYGAFSDDGDDLQQ